MKNILIIDNYDSFVYNLARYFEELGHNVTVVKNNHIDLKGISELGPDGIVISPGPKTPIDTGICIEVIKQLYRNMPILGVCLGHQAIAFSFGGNVVRSEQPMHGKISEILHDGNGLFKGINNPFNATRYHSLVVEKESLPECFEITCETKKGEIMGIRHKLYKLEGVQFHPEAHLTEFGYNILDNFIKML
jgi:para-aminobenzoate synthetase component 2